MKTARHPIASKIIKKMRRVRSSRIVDFQALRAGRAYAEDLHKTVASDEDLAELHPAHAIYMYAQNQTMIMVEQLTALKELDRLTRLISEADDEYMPTGPPMSPLTRSYFTCWAAYDACIGIGRETVTTMAMAVGSAFGMHEELLRVMGLMQDSRMGVYAFDGTDNGRSVLRELVTGRTCKAICPSGYAGKRGELWYVRVLPPPAPGLDDHVVFTTPYLLLRPRENDWLAYFGRVLPDKQAEHRLTAYEHHMKYGPTRNY
jgi:hypothetical protein